MRQPLLRMGAAAALLALLMAAAAALALRPARAAADTQPGEHTLTATGSGAIEVRPDRVVVTAGFEQLAPTAAEAYGKGAEVTAAVVEAVKRAGLPEERIQTAGLRLAPEYQWDEREKVQKLVGYRVSSTLTLTIDDVGRAGAVIDAAVAAGANRLDSIQLTVKNQDELERQAMLLALDDARQKADLAARRLGTQVIGIATVNLNEVSVPIVREATAVPAPPARAAPFPIQAGTTRVEARVTVVFRLP